MNLKGTEWKTLKQRKLPIHTEGLFAYLSKFAIWDLVQVLN